MKIIRSIRQMQLYSATLRTGSNRTGFVPTMGFLHEGHLSLVHSAKKTCSYTIASIFVNPTQFGPNEDLSRYPHSEKKDIDVLREHGVNAVFIPKEEAMYPSKFQTCVTVKNMTSAGESASRPTHFQGVTTVVMKLLNIVQPSALFLGQKDIQQALILKRMIVDMNMSVTVRICPTKREKDGLAMSSRNIYLSGDDRNSALALYSALKEVKLAIANGETSCIKLQKLAQSVFQWYPGALLDYVHCASYESFEQVRTVTGQTVVALAGYVGKTRLIDNIIVSPPK